MPSIIPLEVIVPPEIQGKIQELIDAGKKDEAKDLFDLHYRQMLWKAAHAGDAGQREWESRNEKAWVYLVGVVWLVLGGLYWVLVVKH